MSVPTKIEVTAEDIANGKRGVGWECPIAIAANRAFGMDEGCSFSDDEWEWKLKRYEQRFKVVGGGLFACQFDRGEPVEPQEFDLVRLEDEPEEEDDSDEEEDSASE